MPVIDQTGRSVEIPENPKRIISLVPSLTELLVDLGLEDRICGITKFCVHPAYLRNSKNVVGGTKKVRMDKVAALNPDFILCNKEENTREMVEELEGISNVYVSDIKDINDCIALTSQLGKIFGIREAASALKNEIRINVESFQMDSGDLFSLKVVYLIWKEPMMAAGKGTFIDHMLKLNSFENLVENERYPEVDHDLLRQADVVLLSSEPFPFNERHKREILEQTGVRTLLVDGEFFSWYGSRILKAFDYFKQLRARL